MVIIEKFTHKVRESAMGKYMVEKLEMKTKNIVDENIEKLGKLFPNVVVETESGKAVDFDRLRQELSGSIIEGPKERYQLTWPGKRDATVLTNLATTSTLRPDIKRSVDFEHTKNIFIEGDNLEALKVIQESYLNSIDVIYIDPPYNTGNDYVYRDNFNRKSSEELIASGQMDEDGNQLIANRRGEGKYHSNWLSMIYSRIKISRKLLAPTGILFISIDDNELYNLKNICDEIYGMHNFIACCTRISKRTSNKGNFFKPTKDYVLVYARDIANIDWKFGVENKVNEKEYIYEDEKGKYKKNGASLYQPSLDTRPNQRYYIECPDGSFIIPPGDVFPEEKKDGARVKPASSNDKCWRWSAETYLKNKDKLMFTKASNNCPLLDSEGKPAKWNVYDKVYLDDKKDETLLPEDVIYDYVNSQGTKEILSLDLNFSFAKPVGLVKYLIKLTKLKNDMTVLDFFGGSGTTAQAVMELNAEDNGKRKFIIVQYPEKAEDREYKTISELSETRIGKVAKKIKEQNEKIDCGFRMYRVSSSNMKDVYYEPGKIKQSQLIDLVSNVKEDRTPEDLLTQVMLDLGLKLDLDIEEKTIEKNKVYFVGDKSLVACFDKEIDGKVLEVMCKAKPQKIAFQEISFKDDCDKINFSEIAKKLSPKTSIYVI